MATLLVGIHPVQAALEAGRRKVLRVWFHGRAGHVQPLLALAKERLIPCHEASPEELARKAGSVPHQGVAAEVEELPLGSLNDLRDLRAEGGRMALVALDEVQDPRNLGAILRSAEAFGFAGAVLPARRGAPLSLVTAKAAAGALDWLPLYEVPNLAQGLRALKDADFWIFGAEADGERDLAGLDYPERMIWVIGGEGRGLRPVIRQQCDLLARIPLSGHTSSLNASTAAGIVFAFWSAHQNRKR